MSRIYEALLRAETDRTQESPLSGDAKTGSDERSVGNSRSTTDETEFRANAGEAVRGVERPQAVAEDHLPFIAREQPVFSAAEQLQGSPSNGITSAGGGATLFDTGAGRSARSTEATGHGADDPTAAMELEFKAWMSGDSGKPREADWHPDQKSLPALESRGGLIEQIRVLRSRLHELRLERPLKVIMITSGLPQEGKSFIASNLAVGFAKFRNQRVLLIDADMRRGRLHTVFGASQEPGLTDYLANRSTLSDVMQRMAHPDSGALKSLASLTFIASGHDAENAADLSGNGRFQRLIQAVYDHFDWIIVDSSPVTLVADGVNLARVCDGVVMVVRAGITKYEVAQRAQQELKAAKLVGVVINAVRNAPDVGYYGYDG